MNATTTRIGKISVLALIVAAWLGFTSSASAQSTLTLFRQSQAAAASATAPATASVNGLAAARSAFYAGIASPNPVVKRQAKAAYYAYLNKLSAQLSEASYAHKAAIRSGVAAYRETSATGCRVS